MPGTNFPVAEFLRDHILDARTVSRRGGWWSAVLKIEDPRTKEPYIALYRWRLKEGEWKKATSFKINSSDHVKTIIEALTKFAADVE